MNENIKRYWDKRAISIKDTSSTTNDIWLRELEIKNLIETLQKLNLPKGSKILDVGCGDGHTTISLAKKFPEFVFKGIDYSKSMIENANIKLKNEHVENVCFIVGDVLEVDKLFRDEFNVVITVRCLINLDSKELQKKAFTKIARTIVGKGHYVAIENFVEGHDEMNHARSEIGLPEIPIRWHNFFFKENEIKEIVNSNFEIILIKNFSSSYYFATRIIYSKMCQMKNEQPDYNHEIHQLSINLPNFGNFSPIKILILQKSDGELKH